MSGSSHIDQLKQKHTELDIKLQEALSHPSAADDEIAELKRQKLHLKDRIQKLNG